MTLLKSNALKVYEEGYDFTYQSAQILNRESCDYRSEKNMDNNYIVRKINIRLVRYCIETWTFEKRERHVRCLQIQRRMLYNQWTYISIRHVYLLVFDILFVTFRNCLEKYRESREPGCHRNTRMKVNLMDGLDHMVRPNKRIGGIVPKHFFQIGTRPE